MILEALYLKLLALVATACTKCFKLNAHALLCTQFVIL